MWLIICSYGEYPLYFSDSSLLPSPLLWCGVSAYSLLLLEPLTRTAWGSSITCNAPARVVSALSSCFLGTGASLPYVMPWTDQYPSVDTWPERSNRSHPQPGWMPRSTLSLHSCAESVHITVFTLLVSFVPDPGWTLQRTGTQFLLSMPFCSEGRCLYFPN